MLRFFFFYILRNRATHENCIKKKRHRNLNFRQLSILSLFNKKSYNLEILDRDNSNFLIIEKKTIEFMVELLSLKLLIFFTNEMLKIPYELKVKKLNLLEAKCLRFLIKLHKIFNKLLFLLYSINFLTCLFNYLILKFFICIFIPKKNICVWLRVNN